MARTALLLLSLFVSLSAWSLVGGEANLFPEPGFETSGSPAAAHSGERAGVLSLTDGRGWRAMEYPASIPVEAFATYRAEGWVKGTFDGGDLLALYSYGWNSYGWWFMRHASVPSGGDWRKVQTTFCVPANRVTFHPLVSNGCARVEAYIDEVSIMRIKSAEETISEIRAKADPTPEERALLARWFLDRDDAAGAEALMDCDDDGVRADISCLLAQRAPDREERARRVIDMIRFGCVRWPDAPKRLRELTEDLDTVARARLCLDALARTGGAETAVRAADIIASPDAAPAAGMTVAEADAQLTEVEDLVTAFAAKGNAEAVRGFSDRLARTRAELDARKAALGTAEIRIGEIAVTPAGHRIVIPDEPTPQETRAAGELRAHLESMTGMALDLTRDADEDSRFPIVVGRSTLIARQGIPVDFAALGEEGIRLRATDRALVLTGNRRGVLYAVYTFLEDICGYRQFTEDCVRVPRSGTIRVPAGLDVTYVPPFEYRDTDYPNCRPPRFGVPNKLNGMYSRADESWGGHITYRGFVHTFAALVPPAKYFGEHPEYYSEIKGVRVGPDYTQLCLTHPEVTRIAIETVRTWMRETPDARIISVSQNDWHNYCECRDCTALAEAEGSQAGPLLHFVNAIADAVRDERPDLIIDTLAYQYTRKPPKTVRPRPNVAVRLCSIECCFVHPLESCPSNASFVADIKGWDAICNRLHIWDYVINYAHTIQPFPNLRVLKPNIRFFRDHGVTGIYEEANYFSKGGELAELRTYVMAKLLWNPEADAEAAIDEFVTAYYGAAAPHIARYLERMHDGVCSDTERHVRIYTAPGDYLADEAMLAEAEALFDRAEAAVADDAVLLHRVRVARMPIQYTRLALGQTAFRLEGDAFVTENAAAGLLDRFEATGRAEGVTHVREGAQGGFEPWVQRMRSTTRPVKLLRLRNPRLEVGLIPELGGRVWSIRDMASGREILRRAGSAEAGWQPGEGGIEEYSTADYRAPGWNEIYSVAEQDDTRVVLEASLGNGFLLRRRVELVPGEATVAITSELVNAGAAVREARFRIHPEFAVADTGRAVLRVKGPTGWTEHSLANPEDPRAEKEMWLRGENCPAGEWEIRDGVTGIGIVNGFDPDEIDFCYANWNGAQKRVNLEQWSTQAQLKPGASIRIHNTYRIRSGDAE